MRKRKVGWAAVFLGLVMGVSAAAAEEASSLAARFEEARDRETVRIRWWVPGSMMTTEEIRNELTSLCEAGFGGVEVVPVASSGESGDITDWGSQAWNDRMKEVLETAAELGMSVDFTMTPAWPLALPTILDADDPSSGAQQELDGAFVDGITRGNPFAGALPRSEEAEADAAKVGAKPHLLAVTAARYLDKEQHLLDFASAISVAFDPEKEEASFAPEEDGEYVLFAWWQHASGETKYGNNQVDHYGKAGSQAIMDYWDTELIPSYGEAFSAVKSLFVDSLEFETHLDYTWGLLEDFAERFGYDFAPYLPAVYQSTSIGNYLGEPAGDFSFDVHHAQLAQDWKKELTDLYIENHLVPLSEWCASHGKTLRYQTSYGKTLETARTARYVDIPETESLYGNDRLDFYRLQAGAVHTSGKEIYSIETAPELVSSLGDFSFIRGNGEEGASNYAQTLTDLLWHVQRAYAGGVNQVVWHGCSYDGNYEGEGSMEGALPGISWPGFEGFASAGFSNSWGERQPNWRDVKSVTDFMARTQMALSEGDPQVDVAVYALRTYENIDFLQLFGLPGDIWMDGGALTESGYSYEFLSPESLEEAAFAEGVLSPGAGSYKALVFQGEERLPLATAKKAAQLAKEGFPLVFVGTVPGEDAFYGEEMTAEGETVGDLTGDLLSLPNVALAEEISQVPEVLKELGVNPAMTYEGAALTSVHRKNGEGDLYYLYPLAGSTYPENKAASQETYEITLEGEGVPYRLDAWKGTVEKIPGAVCENGTASFSLTLQSNESALVLLGGESVESAESEESEESKESKEGETPVQKTMDETLLAEIQLGPWSLTIDSFEPGSSPLETVHEVYAFPELSSLVPWRELPDMEKVSGIGTYRASLAMEEAWEEGIGLMLDLGEVKDTFQVRVNGQQVPVSQTCTLVDIGEYLAKGENELEISVASTLLNAVIAANGEDTRQPDAYGILQDVRLLPYRTEK